MGERHRVSRWYPVFPFTRLQLGRAGRGSPGVGTGQRARPASAAWLILAFGTACTGALASDLIEISGRAMGTIWSAKFEPPAGSFDPATVKRAIVERLEALEQQCSTYRPHSTLSRFNAARHTDWVPIDRELAGMAAMSRRISELTGGAFDVTVHPLVTLWGFGPVARSGALPAADAIAAARASVDWRQLEVQMSPPALRKARPEITADFSSIAKGFAVDEMSALLSGLGVPNHLVRIGGDLKSAGPGAAGRGWRTGVEQPGANPPALASVVELQGQALSTSGNYRNVLEAVGRRYGHIIDPRTGEPVTGTLVAVSVAHASSAQSSALATGLFVLGADEGFRLAAREGLACLFLVREDATIVQRMTPGFERLLVARK